MRNMGTRDLNRTVVLTATGGAVAELAVPDDFPTVDDQGRREASSWLEIAPDTEDSPRADPTIAEAVSVTAMFTYVVGGCVGNFAYDLFPAAARLLKLVWRGQADVDADEAATLALGHVLKFQARAGDQATLERIRRRDDGTWRAVVGLSSGARMKVFVSPDGNVVESRPA